MRERLFRGDGVEHERSRREDFDPIAEGKRHGLTPEVSAALWEQARREATNADGVCDENAARARFVQLAELIARRGGKLGPEPFHWTQVDVASGLLPAPSSLAERVPGRTTLVLGEASARARASISGAPGRTTLVASYAAPEVSSIDESRGFFRRYVNGGFAARAKLERAIAARDHYAAVVAVGALKQDLASARRHLANGLEGDAGLRAELAALAGPAEQLLATLPNLSAGGRPWELWGPSSAEWRAATSTTDDRAPRMENVGPRAETQGTATWQPALTPGREAGAFAYYDAVGAALRGDLMTISQVLALDAGKLDIVVDALPGVRGMQLGATVYLDRDALAAGGETARYVLAHELVHLAQRALPARPELDYMAAEAEAASLGRSYARGHGLERPSVGLGATQVARDEGGQSDDAKLLASPPPLVRSVGLFAVTYKPATDAKWVGGIDKKRQALAATLQDLVGKSVYTVQLLDQVITAYGGSDRFAASGNIEGKATQDDAVRQFTIQGPLMLDLVKILTDKGLKVSLTKENLEALQGGIDATDTWEDFKGYVPDWMTKNLYAGLIALTAKTVLTRYANALRAATDNGGAKAEKELIAARQATIDAIGMPIDVMEAVRADKKLVKEPAYRVLWDLPAVAETKDAEVAVAAFDRPPAQSPAFYFLSDQLVDKPLAKQALASHDARKKVLERFSTRLALRQLPTDGDTVLGDGASKPARPPLGSTLTTYPQLEPPFFDTPKGGDREFVMSIAFSDVFEAFRGYVYKWELIHVPDDAVEKLNETADDQSQHGTSPGQLDVLGGRLSRDVEYGSADIRRAIGVLKSQLGEPGIGAVSLAAVGGALRIVGTVIKTFIETLLKPRYEKTMPFDSDGLYIVRCISWPQPNSSSVIDRTPSVAWLPIWVRPARDMSKLRANVDDKIRLGGIERLKEIEDELKDPKLTQQRRDDLNNEKQQIETSLHGTGDDVLVMEKQQLETAAKTAEGGFQLEQIKKRIAEIEEIQKMRTSRVAGATTDGSFEALTRIPAAFVGDNAQTIRPLFEVYQKANTGTQLVYHAIDSTTKNSGHRDGDGATREDAIANAIQNILESDQGYGRGYVTITIPATPGTPGAQVAQRTIRIEKSLGGILEEALENLATIAAIAAVAAAPFTGGASLALLVPIGIVGAIPSAYRLIDRGQQGTLRFDMATAMDVVNILGAAVGAGQASAAGKAALRGVQLGRGWMILGLGTDGLGMLVAGAGVIDQINELSKDPNMPPGLRNAMIAQIIGNQLVQIGMMVGATLSAHGRAQQEALGGNKPVEVTHAPIEPAIQEKFRAEVGPNGKDITVYRDADGKQVEGAGVELQYSKDGYGLPTDVKVVAGPGASEKEILGHAKTARGMLEHQGLLGYLRNLLDRLVLALRGKTAPKKGSRAWEAKQELEKLPDLIYGVYEDLKAGKISEEAAASKMKDLQAQMLRYEQAVNELGEGKGFIASHDNVTKAAVDKGYPPSPKDHFYYETSDGNYQLQRAVDSTEPPQHVESHNGKWVLVAGEAPRATAGADVTVLKESIAERFGVTADKVKLHADPAAQEPSVKVNADGSVEVHYKEGTPRDVLVAAADRAREIDAAAKDTKPLVDAVKTQVAGESPSDFEWRWTDDDAARVVAEGRKLGLTDQQIKDLIRIAQRKDQMHEDGTVVKKQLSPDELIGQMHSYKEVIEPRGYPYRFASKKQFEQFGHEIKKAAAAAGLPTDDIRIQGSSLRNPAAKDVDVAILIADNKFDTLLVKTFEGKIKLEGKPVTLDIAKLGELVTAIRADQAAGKKYNWLARTLAHAFEKRTIRVDDLPQLKSAKDSMKNTYGSLDITVMSSGGYLDREPVMVVP